MPKMPLSFPVFYHCAVKGKTNLPQYDAVRILLLGNTREAAAAEIEIAIKSDVLPSRRSTIDISDADAANYVSGKKSIKKDVFAEVVDLSVEEAEDRLERLGIQDITGITEALKHLIDNLDLKPDIREQLLSSDHEGKFTLAANMFLMSIRYPRKQLVPLSESDKNLISFCFVTSKKQTENSNIMTQEEIEAMLSSSNDDEQAKKPRILSNEEIEALLGSNGDDEQAQKPHVMTAEEIDKALRQLSLIRPKAPPPSPPPPPKIKPYRDHITTCTFHIGALAASAFSELTSIILSSGATSLSDLFGEIIRVDIPEFAYYINFETLSTVLFNDTRVRLVFKFFGEDPPESPLSLSSIPHGYIVLSADQAMFDDYYEQLKQVHPDKFIMYTEAMEYEASMYREIGSIFSGSCVTALSGLSFGARIRIKEASILHMKQTLEEMGPIFAGTLPISFSNSSGSAFLLLDCKSAQILLSSQQEFL